MTSLNAKALILAMIAGQMLVGIYSGRAVFLAHCDPHGHEHQDDCHHPSEGCDSGDACLAVLTHDHSAEPDHDHPCRCAHVHYRSDLRPVARPASERLGRLGASPIARSSAATAGGLHSGAPPALAGRLSPPDGWSPVQLAIRSVRLLI